LLLPNGNTRAQGLDIENSRDLNTPRSVPLFRGVELKPQQEVLWTHTLILVWSLIVNYSITKHFEENKNTNTEKKISESQSSKQEEIEIVQPSNEYLEPHPFWRIKYDDELFEPLVRPMPYCISDFVASICLNVYRQNRWDYARNRPDGKFKTEHQRTPKLSEATKQKIDEKNAKSSPIDNMLGEFYFFYSNQRRNFQRYTNPSWHNAQFETDLQSQLGSKAVAEFDLDSQSGLESADAIESTPETPSPVSASAPSSARCSQAPARSYAQATARGQLNTVSENAHVSGMQNMTLLGPFAEAIDDASLQTSAKPAFNRHHSCCPTRQHIGYGPR